MIEVHFYKETELKYSVYANSIEDVIEAPADYYAEYTTDMVISAVKYANPVLDNGNLREATREELVAKGIEVQLEPGEIIQDKKLVKIPQPSQYHEWNGDKWTCCLETLKNKKREELKAIREDKVHSNFKISLDKEYDFQFREKDVNNFISFKSTLDILKTLGVSDIEDADKLKTFNVSEEIIEKIKSFLSTGKVPWILADNSIELFEFEKILLIQALFNFRKEEIYFKFGELSTRLESCKTIEEIEAIIWQ